jgi:hypothetical protein
MSKERPENGIPERVVEAARSLGWLPPQSEEEVRRAEAEAEGKPLSLPDELRDPKEVFDRPTGRAVPSINPPEDARINATLSRAAREAGHLSPEIEEAMRRDREATEKEADGDDDGKDVR